MSTRKRSTAKKWVAFGIIMTVIVGLTTAFLLQPTPSLYDSVEAKLGDITSYYSFTGNVETKNRETVLSDKVMQISKINVKEGEMVDKDDIIIHQKQEIRLKLKLVERLLI